MSSSLIERQVENVVQDVFDDKAVRIVKGISKLAAKQGGESTMQNYKLLGKRALIALAVVVVAVQLTSSAVGFMMSRKNEEKRIEQVVHRVLDEERQKEAAKDVS
ncbi:MAG: hypothetical protein Q4D34_02730 [Eggerthellaceae bacterium]|nr:hypothetical protein [Eggerthellaceae bacterium]